ncbi:MAG TPA: TonB-dependent receptor plug domain-containing protein, partial [Planctomycetota bacterium]|nr:TonB-dependent receptor plug domain-containing protein [Planctomycetota bacterium]
MVLVQALLSVWASPVQDAPVKKESDVVITASRMEEPAADVASSVTVVPGSRLERARQRLVLEALREVPSIDVVQSGPAGGLSSLFLRGGASGQTLVLVDGVEMNDPVSSDRAFDFAHLTTDDVERIEVLRGPQSVLYGSNAMGGVIHVITRRGAGDPKVRLTAEAGSYATYRGGVALAGGSDRVDYSVAASRLQTQGFSAADEEDENTEKDGYRNQTITARIGVKPSSIVDADVVVRGIESRSEVDNFGGPGGDDPNHVIDFSQWLFRAAPRVRLLDGAWEQTPSVAVTTIDFTDDNPPDAASGGAFTFGRFESELVDLDWQHTFALHESQTLVAGAEFEEETARSATEDSFFGSSVLRKQEAWTRSAYAQHRVHLWDRLTVTGGARV